ncbi:MAG: hypothetical protein GF309_15700 [Candidatus Lokiarchaeota archaeon]|nr:hypothetical protein [Candidatus Lokiarchaeota archaeon]
MRESRAIIVGLVVICLLMLCPRSQKFPELRERLIEHSQTELSGSYTRHEPISVSNDSGFSSQGWPGEGSLEDPYVIADLNITNASISISIVNTTAHFEISNCRISSTAYTPNDGILFRNVTHGKVRDCIISHHGHGIKISSSRNINLESNTVHHNLDSGLYLVSSVYCTLSSNCAFSNSLEDYQAAGGFFIVECNKTVLSKNVAYENNGRGYLIRYSYGCKLAHNTAHGNDLSGFFLYVSETCLLRSNTASNNSVDDFYSIGGFRLLGSKHCLLENNTSSKNHGNGFLLAYGENATVADNTARDNKVGFNLDFFDDTRIVNNTAFGNSDGFTISFSDYMQVTGNTGSNNSETGFLLTSSSLCVFFRNTAIGNELGVALEGSCEDNILYENRLGYNEETNGLDNSWTNAWDNGASGNYWSDYDGSDQYIIPGSANNTDRHPHLLDLLHPRIDHPSDVIIIAYTPGENITWNPSDRNPYSFEVYQNGILIQSGYWNGSRILTDISEIDSGVYNFTLVVYDKTLNSVSDTVIVEVRPNPIDAILPGIVIVLGVAVTFVIIQECREFVIDEQGGS